MNKLKMGMIGGGIGAFIGGVHRIAAAMDNQIELVCGAFSSSAEKSIQSGIALGLPQNRCYGSFEEMIQKESQLDEDERMDFVAIVTPNHMHFAPAKMALENGFHVICDKPVTFNLDEAYELKKIIEKQKLIFALTHNYTGYPMVKQAKAMIANGDFGKIRKAIVEYSQGWLATKLEDTNQKQAAWRSDPKRSGAAGAMGDIGTHAENLLEYISGQQITSLCSDLTSFVEGRLLDDDGSVLLRMSEGAKGVLIASQIMAGEENNLKIKVFGEKGGLEWQQMKPNSLVVKWLDQPQQEYRTGVGNQYPQALAAARIPAGHPEGYLEAFANIYKEFATAVTDFKNNELKENYDFPNIDDGIRGMVFIDKVVDSSEQGSIWVEL